MFVTVLHDWHRAYHQGKYQEVARSPVKDLILLANNRVGDQSQHRLWDHNPTAQQDLFADQIFFH